MNKVLLIAHGNLAEEMKNSAEMIFGKLNNIDSISFFKDDGLETLQNKINGKIDDNSNYLIFCDLFCGTPYNASCSVALNNLDRNIEVISGMSLPLILEVASQIDSTPLNELLIFLKESSKDVVQYFDKKIIDEEDDL